MPRGACLLSAGGPTQGGVLHEGEMGEFDPPLLVAGVGTEGRFLMGSTEGGRHFQWVAPIDVAGSRDAKGYMVCCRDFRIPCQWPECSVEKDGRAYHVMRRIPHVIMFQTVL